MKEQSSYLNIPQMFWIGFWTFPAIVAIFAIGIWVLGTTFDYVVCKSPTTDEEFCQQAGMEK